MRFEQHFEASALIAAPPAAVFAYIDDPARLAGHMTTSSWMMGGGSMTVQMDAARGQAPGSRITMTGRAFGLTLSLDEVIEHREPPTRKVWHTIGSPQLVVIGGYRMGCELGAGLGGTKLRVFIDYDLPARQRWLGQLLGRGYARWCTERMLQDTRSHFAR